MTDRAFVTTDLDLVMSDLGLVLPNPGLAVTDRTFGFVRGALVITARSFVFLCRSVVIVFSGCYKRIFCGFLCLHPKKGNNNAE